MVQKFTFQICQKFAIAAALVATFYCLPVVAQTNQANETLILNNKPITFAELLKTYPDQAELRKVLMTIDRKTRNEFRDWEMAQLNKRSAEQDAEMARLDKRRAEQDAEMARLDKKSAEQDAEMARLDKRRAEQDAEMARLNKREAEQDAALKLSQEFGVVLDEIFKEQSAPKPATPEQQAINKKRAATIMAAMEHPLIGGSKKYSPSARQIALLLAKGLHAGENINWADKKMIQSLLDTSK